MDVSIHDSKPEPGIRLRAFTTIGWIALWLMLESAGPPSAFGFTVTPSGQGSTVRLRPEDISQDGSPLGPGSEQTFSLGTFQGALTDFSTPLDVNLSGALAGPMTARIDRVMAFRVRLSNAERDRCLGNRDFNISLNVVGPVPGSFAAATPGGGELRVLSFAPTYRGGGGRCPRNLSYGYALALDVEGAAAAGAYRATAEIVVELNAPGGATQTIQLPLEVQMPGMLLLYHHSRINVNLSAAAIAGTLGASSACSGGHCMSLGQRSMGVTAMGIPVSMNLGGGVPPFVPVQTITLLNAVGARATGCSGNVYDTASYQIQGAVGGIQDGTGVIPGIQGETCGLFMRTGDLAFDLDLNAADASAATATATIQITVTGL